MKIKAFGKIGFFSVMSMLMVSCDQVDEKKYECIDTSTHKIVDDDFCEDSRVNVIASSSTANFNTSTKSSVNKENVITPRYTVQVRSGYFSNSSSNAKASGVAARGSSGG